MQRGLTVIEKIGPVPFAKTPASGQTWEGCDIIQMQTGIEDETTCLHDFKIIPHLSCAGDLITVRAV